MSASRKSPLDLVNECDNFPYHWNSAIKYREFTSDYYEFHITGYDGINFGYVTAAVAEKFPTDGIWKLDRQQKHLILHMPGSNLEDRNGEIAKSLQDMREKNTFQVLSGWRSELYPIYGPGRELVLSMERSATPLLGVLTYGVHMTAFVRTPKGLKIWAPKRSETKQTYPGMMDNTAAGGLSTGEKPFDCLIREAAEEASLPEEIVRSSKACGTLTYFHVRDSRAGGETGLCQPECQYIYDLELPDDVIPKPDDNEAVDFRLLSLDELQDAMAEGRFKPNCALLLVEFLIRHGVLTAENEPDYIEIVARCHRRLEFPTP